MAEADAKVGSTQHSPRHPNGTSKRAIDPVNAKVGSTQHSPPKKSHSSSPDDRGITSVRKSRDKRRSSASKPRSASAEERKRDHRKSPREARRATTGSEEGSTASSSDEEGTVATPKHILKPTKFDGQSSFETFMAQFANCAEHNKWNDAQKLTYLRNSLDKEAAYVLWDYGKDVIGSLSGLMNILETRFGGKAVADKHRIELRNRRRRAGKIPQSVHSYIRRLAALAYPSMLSNMREEITCDHFLDALGDPDFALKIRECQPADLDSALRIALQLEVWKQDMARHRETARPERGRNVREMSNRKQPEPPLEAMHKDLERVKKYLEFDKGPTRNPNNSGFSSDRRPDLIRHTAPSAYHAGRAPGSASPTAWSSSGQNAAGRGQRPNTYHPSVFARPLNGNGNRNGNFYRAPDPNSGCFYCGDPAHRARDCTAPPAAQRRHDPPPTPRPQPPEQRHPQTDVRPVKDHSNKQEKTCIWVKYRQHKLSTLIDTGSDISIAGESLADDMGWTIHPHHVKEVSVANNDTMTVLEAAHVTLSVEGHGVELEILIAPELDGLILGIDWLRTQGSIWWDFDQGRIKFGRRDWVRLRKEAEPPHRTSIIRKYSPMTNCRGNVYGTGFHAAPTGSVRRFHGSKLNRKFLH